MIFDCKENKRKEGGRLTNFFKKDAAKNEIENRRDLVRVEITKNGDLVSEGDGSYLEQITFNQESLPMWTINESDDLIRTKWVNPSPHMLLPSDSSLRRDSIKIKEQQFDEAESFKEEMEKLQRHDKKLRDAADKTREKRPSVKLQIQTSSLQSD